MLLLSAALRSSRIKVLVASKSQSRICARASGFLPESETERMAPRLKGEILRFLRR